MNNHRNFDKSRSSGFSGQQNRGYQKGGSFGRDNRPTEPEKKPEALIPLPRSIREKASQLTHPGLALDKYAKTLDSLGEELSSNVKQERQKENLKSMIKISHEQDEPRNAWQAFHARQSKVWQALGCQTFQMETISGLSLHLARASALENAGICLHNLYGFPIIPGSGLKGLTRSWATQTGIDADKIRKVFGSSADVKAGLSENAGCIVFYDAIPATWPGLSVDIVNNHHSGYYSSEGNEAPGDWENPVPVYFLTVNSGSQFVFALGKARAQVSDDLLKEVTGWLQAALSWSGAGAKTNAGYGLFKSLGSAESPEPSHRAVFTTTLELVSPAFLAGAMQNGEDCDLRPATLRGMLRWWWRTLHSGYLSSKDLYTWESKIFGSAAEGGALQIRIERLNEPEIYPYDKQYLVNNFPSTGDKKTTQGLWYHSFGMDEKSGPRYFVSPGAKWTITLLARQTETIAAKDVLEQAKSALHLLCYYGAVGAKQKKGWGSFADLPGFDLLALKATANAFRSKTGYSNQFNPELAESPSLEQIVEPLNIETNWTNTFWALHQIGMAAQAFSREYWHSLEKKALGLPRNIKPLGKDSQGRPQFKGQFKSEYKLNRHSSPTQFHLACGSDGKLTLRAIFFVSPRLPDAKTSRAFLKEYRDFLAKKLNALLPQEQKNARPNPNKRYQRRSQNTALTSTQSSKSSAVPAQNLKPGERVKAVLLSEKTKKGGWKAKHLASGLSGVITNSGDVTGNAGDEIELIVNTVTPAVNFRWPRN